MVQRHGLPVVPIVLVWIISLFLFSIYAINAVAQSCNDPHCMKVEDIPTRSPAQRVRHYQNSITENSITGLATLPSGAVIEDVPVREGKPSPRRVKVRRYPLDLTVGTNITLGYGDVMQFTLKEVKYIASVISFDEHNAQLKFLPAREFSNISPEESKVYDVDHDGIPDFGLTMGVVEGKQATFIVVPTSEVEKQKPSPLADATGYSSPVPPAVTTSLPPSGSLGSSDSPSSQPPTPVLTPFAQPTLSPTQQYIPPSIKSQPPVELPSSASPSTPPLAIPPIESPVISESPNAQPSIHLAAQPAPSNDANSLLFWGILIALIGLSVIGTATVVVMRREQEHVTTVTDYILRSLGRKIPMSQAVEALSQAGWNKRTIDKALVAIATRYKADGTQKGQLEDAIRNQLAGSGMPEEALSQVFKNKNL